MPLPSPPNVIVLVWDAARLDYVAEHASTVAELREDNVWFQRAIAPSTWSLPSHASLFTGEYPHEHGRYRIHDNQLNDLPLVASFADRGYSTVAVSGNGFAGPITGFHEPFDKFHYTADFDRFDRGINVGQRLRELRWENEDVGTGDLFRTVLAEVLTDKNPLRSTANLGSVLTNRVATRVSLLQKLPWPIFNSLTQYSYSPEKNTRRITSHISDTEDPFFLFANYMDPHRPYYPPKSVQRDHLDSSLSYRQIKRVNEIAAPWEFIKRSEDGEDLSATVDQIRSLYTGEIESVDNHLGHLISHLQSEGVYKDTLIVVTSDHGENLGDRDLLGNRRMGHEASISEDLLQVPLMLINPALDGSVISEPVSLTDLFSLLTTGLDDQQTRSPASYFCTGEVVLSEYPALGDEDFAEQHPDVSRDAIELRTSVHHTIAISKEWTVLVDSRGKLMAWQEGTERSYESAPSRLKDAAEESLESLIENEQPYEELSEAQISQLEALGYR